MFIAWEQIEAGRLAPLDAPGLVLDTWLAGWALPLVLGPTRPALIGMVLLFSLGSASAGEVIYKVWAQEHVPTLLRSTSQGVTLAVARVSAALFASVTPTLALTAPRLLFSIVFVTAVVAACVGLFWIPRLPKARSDQEQPHRYAGNVVDRGSRRHEYGRGETGGED